MALYLKFGTKRSLMLSRLGGQFSSSRQSSEQCNSSSKASGDGGGAGASVSYVFPTKNLTYYEMRKFIHEAANSDVQIPFPAVPQIPNGAFRVTAGERLGPCASKEWEYKNPEYYSFHRMSFFDFHQNLSKMRVGQPDPGRKCITF